MNAQTAQMVEKVSTQTMYEGNKRLGTQITIAAQPGQREVKVDPAVLRSTLRASGAPDWLVDLVKDPDSPHVRLKRSIGNTKKGKSETRDAEAGHTLMWVRGGIRDGFLTYILYDLTADPSNPKGKAVSTVTVAKTGGDPVFNHIGNHPEERYVKECEAVQKRYRESAGFLNSNNIRDLINDAVLGNFAKEQRTKRDHEKKGVGYKRRVRHGMRLLGSVSYLVPKGEDTEIWTMREALDEAGYGMATNSVMPHDSAAFTGQIEHGMASQVEDMMREFDSFSDAQRKMNDGKGPSKYVGSAYKDRMEQLDDIVARAKFYEDQLGFNLSRVAELAKKAQETIEAEKQALWAERF